MRMSLMGTVAVLAAGLAAATAWATADGPDFFRVRDVAPDDVLNMRAAPDAGSTRIGEIPHDADGITSFGCIGYLDIVEWEKATPEEREAAARRVWCKVGYLDRIGWVAGRFLAEGTESERPGTQAMLDHAGTEWRMVSFVDDAPSTEVWIRFAAANRLSGSTGCNHVNGAYVQRGLDIMVGDLAATRKMCPDDAMATEARTLDVLARARGIAGGLYTMALFDGEGRLLATFRRTDWD